MAEKNSLTVKICNWITKYSIYAAIFLIPIFFLSWTSDVLDFNKQAVLIFLGAVALFAWMLKSIISGKIDINVNKMHIVVGAFFLVYLLATLFSINKAGSFWGWPQSTSESMLSLVGFAIFYFLVSNTFSKQNVFVGAIILSVSALVAEILGVLQLAGLFIIPLNFAKSVSFNTIGSAGSLGFFVATLLPLAIVMLIVSKKWWRALFIVQIILTAIILFAINYHIVWWSVVLGSAIVMVFGIMKRNLFDGRWMAIPMFFLAVSLFFILLNPQTPWLAQRNNEIYLSQNTSLNISLQAIKERPIFGSGPGTFSYNFLKFKDPVFSQSALGNTVFSQGTSRVLNSLASTGIIGFIVLLAILALPIYYGIKFLILGKETSTQYWVLTLGVTSALVVQVLMSFLYNSNMVLGFINFLMIACLIALISSDKKQYELKPSSFLTLLVTFVFTLVFIFGLGLLILCGQKYVAEIKFNNAVLAWQTGDKVAGQKGLEEAASLNSSSDLYFRQLSQVYLFLLQDQLQNAKATMSDEEKNKLQIYIANAVNAASIATDINPKNSSNWSNRGYIYQSLNGLMGDSTTWANNSYAEALKLDPNEPYLLTQQGSINFISASALGTDKADQKNQLLNTAKTQLEKAITLNPNYSDGLYSLGLVYDALGQKDKAIEQFTKVQQLNPKDITIPKILSNLKSGLPALQSPPPANPPTENSSDNTIKNSPVK